MHTASIPQDLESSAIVKTRRFDLVAGTRRLDQTPSLLTREKDNPHVVKSFREMIYHVAEDYTRVLIDLGEDSHAYIQNALATSDMYVICLNHATSHVQLPLAQSQISSWLEKSLPWRSKYIGCITRQIFLPPKIDKATRKKTFEAFSFHT
jgi:cellulose biosynthesis protein BcsQ